MDKDVENRNSKGKGKMRDEKKRKIDKKESKRN